MAGYTRQSTASILNGQAITAPPLTAEFNQLASAFNASSGHTHDGSTGNSNKINLVTSVTGFLPAVNGGIGGKNKSDATAAPVATNDTTEGYAVGSLWTNVSTGRVYICIVNTGNAAVWRELVQVTSGNAVLPDGTDNVDLGSNSVRFQDLFLSGGIAAALNVAVGGTLNVTGNTAIGGTLGVTGDATFANLSATGTTTITSVDLNSGAIDNAPIGTSTPAAGTFTTLNANTSLVAATADINGGTLDGATIGASTPSTGSFTTLGASGTTTLATVDINAGAIDGTTIGASSHTTGKFTTLQSTGAATLASVNIDGGAIDGTTIGASATSSGAFTTITSSGGITGALTGNVTGNTAGVHTGAVTGNVTGDLTGNVTASSGSSSFNNVVVNGNLNMNAGTSATITNLTAPSADLDAATKKYVDDEISTLVGDAGAGLNTLGELADALNDDDSFSATVTASIATKLPKAGGTMSGAIAMGTSKITGLGDPTSNQDASTKSYTDAQRNSRLATAGGTMSGAIAMGNNKVTGLATPTAGTDATTKTYVDTIHGSAVAAATSASNASTSASNASASENNASNSASAASSSAASAATSFDLFDDRMLGAKSSAPSVDNDGNALVTGTLYFDTTASAMKVYSGSGWVNAGSSVNGTTNRYSYTATAGQTVFAATYDAGYVDVFLNGVKQLIGTDVTATSGSSVVFASGTSVNDIVEIVGYGTFVLADHLTQTQSDARYVNLSGNTMTGDLTVPNLVVSGLVDGVDIAARDAVLTSTTTTANAALPLAGGTLTGDVTFNTQLGIGAEPHATASLNITNTNQHIRLNNGSELGVIALLSSGELDIWGHGANESINFRTGAGSGEIAMNIVGNNVGIGLTSNISSKLHVNSEVSLGPDNNNRMIVGSTSGGIGSIGTIQGGTASFSTMTFKSGNVGIGVTNPLTKLHLNSPITNAQSANSSRSYKLLEGYGYTTGGNYYGQYAIGTSYNSSSNTGTLEFFTGSGSSAPTKRMTIDSSGNVGIGTSAPQDILHLNTNNAASHLRMQRFEQDTALFDGDEIGGIEFWANDASSFSGASTLRAAIRGEIQNTSLGTRLEFWTGNSNATVAERMRIIADGQINFRCTATPGSSVAGFAMTSDQFYTSAGNTTGTNAQVRFYNGNGLIGSITTSGSATAFNTSSDYRLKENISDMTGATARLKQLKPKRFNWIADSDNTVQDGFLAHEVSSVVPEAVFGTKDAEIQENGDGYQSLDHSKLVPLLVKTIQELEARITALEAG